MGKCIPENGTHVALSVSKCVFWYPKNGDQTFMYTELLSLWFDSELWSLCYFEIGCLLSKYFPNRANCGIMSA